MCSGNYFTYIGSFSNDTFDLTWALRNMMSHHWMVEESVESPVIETQGGTLWQEFVIPNCVHSVTHNTGVYVGVEQGVGSPDSVRVKRNRWLGRRVVR